MFISQNIFVLLLIEMCFLYGRFSNQLKSAIWGFVVGDALGVPHEFKSREQMDTQPATEMIGYGTHDQPPGTWSDDSSLMFCLMESLNRGYDLEDLAHRFVNWYCYGYWTPHGEAFDIGYSTSQAIQRMGQGGAPIQCGGRGEHDNGNGALMRILPMAFHLIDENDQQIRFQKVMEVASLTHGHDISHIGCFIYTELLQQLLLGRSWQDTLNALPDLKSFLSGQGIAQEYLSLYNAVFDSSFTMKKREEIHSSGFVVHTLEASLWCINRSDTYKDAVLSAINLGDDTDTTAAVNGGVAGLLYNLEQIPENWMLQITKKEEIDELIIKFSRYRNHLS